MRRREFIAGLGSVVAWPLVTVSHTNGVDRPCLLISDNIIVA